MSRVFDELGPKLKDIRNQLNDLTIQKSGPKARMTKRGGKRSKPQAASVSLPSNDCLRGKAGRTAVK